MTFVPRISVQLSFLLIFFLASLIPAESADTASKATNGVTTNPALTPLQWSERMANSEMARLGDTRFAPPKGGWWDYSTGIYADSLIRLSWKTGNPAYEKNAEETIGSFIAESGEIATYQKRRPMKPVLPVAGGGSTNATVTASATPADEVIPTVKIAYSLDDLPSGMALLKLYDITHEERYRKAADILRDQLRHHPRVAEGGFWHKAIYPDQMWLDGLYMAEPFYAAYAARFKETEDFDDVAKQFTIVASHTYNPKTQLLYHGWDEKKLRDWANPVTGTSASFWSRAIGWYVMGLVDVLDSLPEDHPKRAELITLLQNAAAGIVNYQDPSTGVWWQVTDQGSRKNNYLESTASCMFVYALAKGVNHGYLPRSMIPAIREGYRGIIREFVTINPDGKINLTKCCKVAGLGLSPRRDGSFDYYTIREPIDSNDLKGMGPFINAGVECDRLFGKEIFSH